MKKITRRSFLTVCGAVAAAAALTACGGSASSAAASSTSAAAGSTASSTAAALSGNVATGGSTSMKNVIAALTEGFAEVEPGVTVSYDPTGSGAGITGATDKTLDIGLSSRALKDDEKADVDGTTIALDCIAIIVNNASKVEDLTVDQLKQMFTGEITN
uniref:substrate-binding domain-containing protein n=1 Tax=Faecalibacterium sp. TaxID=1971605 RepID=UPI003FEDF106